MNRHPDPEVRTALTRLLDALCTWERCTGRSSVSILREAGGFQARAVDGKRIDLDVPDEVLLASVVSHG